MTSRSSDPLRPADHFDSEAPLADTIAQPRLGPLGYARFFWRQLTSMRTALILLLLLALAAVPGSLVPQRTSDPNGVIQFQQRDPELFKTLDAFGLFSTFSAPWFSAIYLLLFVSLVGCIVPRAKHHFDALRARPPKTPQRLQRLVGYSSQASAADPAVAIDEAARLLRRQGYRVARYPAADEGREGERLSVSAERGYLRETGNLIFHAALVGVLVVIGFGGGFSYTGQRVLVEGEPFTNVLLGYDSFNPGRFFTEGDLQPFSMRLDKFTPEYEFDKTSGAWHPLDFTASLSTREKGGDWKPATLKVNSPVSIGGTDVYLLGNGYAPVLTIRNADGDTVFDEAVPYVEPDANLASRGVIKVPDGLDKQLALMSFFYPDPVEGSDGIYSSFSPNNYGHSLVTAFVYEGDLGLDTGAPVNAYTLDPTGLTQIAGADSGVKALKISPGQTVALPNGLGTIEYSGLKRYISVDIHHDGTQWWILTFAVLVLGGLLISLFVPRRRVWITATAESGTTRLEYAGLARGEDPTLPAAVADLARRHREVLGDDET
ncbi:MAG TPA: cytochrome c biogenesis protein ResB [Pseudolysinimonas sp.]|nr:cytochrome c biogenesis protein ResB [Pseudolysinimonas sp.]